MKDNFGKTKYRYYYWIEGIEKRIHCSVNASPSVLYLLGENLKIPEMQIYSVLVTSISAFLLFNVCLSQESEKILQHLSFTGAFITRLNRACKKQPLRRLSVDGLLSCGHACMKLLQCSSFNYEISALKQGLCELNEIGISTDLKEDLLEERPGFIYVQPERDVVVSIEVFICFQKGGCCSPRLCCFTNIKESQKFLIASYG